MPFQNYESISRRRLLVEVYTIWQELSPKDFRKNSSFAQQNFPRLPTLYLFPLLTLQGRPQFHEKGNIL
jgi:hypothetical protein